MTVPEFARHWARQLGCSEASLIQLQGGINNRVFLCGEGSVKHVIKGYSDVTQGQRDRMQAEVDFLNYACLVAPHYVPQLVHHDFSIRCIVIEHLDGEAYTESVVPAPRDIAGALNFFQLLNTDRAAAKKHISLDAAEGFLRLSEHVANARHRLSQMGTDHLPRELQIQATDLLKKLNAASERAINKTESLISSGIVSDVIDPDQRCISPSDFGFHNAIRTNSGPRFIDFEFSGWDDPAKAAVDFALQPGVPTGTPISSLLAAANCNQINIIKKRCETLGPVLRIKWLCIILAVLQPERLMRVLVTHPQIEPEALIYQRLIQAEKYLQQETPFGLH
jgi:hypothetical protein